ncbi:hypothetical protein [Ekhidna sp.]
MLKKNLHILIALLLIATTSSSVWGQYVVEKEGIEISEQFEKDAEKGEKELEDKFDGWDSENANTASITLDLFSGFIKSSSSTFIPTSLQPKKLFIEYHRLKIHC